MIRKQSKKPNAFSPEGLIVDYTSSNPNVATVDGDGVVTALSLGKTTITATIAGTDISDTCEVTVTPRQFTINWSVGGQSTASSVSECAMITEPQPPIKPGYAFIGWSPEVPSTMPANDLTFTAVFECISKISINPPSIMSINYGDILVLTANVENMPVGAYVKWEITDGKGVTIVSQGKDNNTCCVKSADNGTATVTARVVDKDGKPITNNSNGITASQTITSKAGFFQKLINFFKNLFGASRIIAQTISDYKR